MDLPFMYTRIYIKLYIIYILHPGNKNHGICSEYVENTINV